MNKGKFLALGAALAVALVSGSAFAAGDAAKGAKVFNRCKACHSIKPHQNRVGPSLAGVVGRKAGSYPGYNRYVGLKGADWTWDEKNLDEWLAGPKKFLKGKRTAMSFHLRKESERQDVIAYLKEHAK